MIFRIQIAALIGGAMLAFFGVQEYRVSSSATVGPIEVDLAAVEKGEVDENNHWRLGEHIAIYGACVYQYRQSKYETGEPGPSTKLDYCYYPVVSFDHPFIQQFGEAESGADVPLNDFRVLVKTKKYDTLGSIPDGLGNQDSVQGLVVNLISGLDSEEKELFTGSFPGLDTDKLLLLEEGRAPAPIGKSLGMIGGGLALVLGSVLWFFRGASDAA
ncbi:hypothetical protein MalM25_05380 [Planctomycetes bacterium MalM25]|nr:hypothetical protein MalM25_05380 [Planctomycetes bacterium MalM25]